METLCKIKIKVGSDQHSSRYQRNNSQNHMIEKILLDFYLRIIHIERRYCDAVDHFCLLI